MTIMLDAAHSRCAAPAIVGKHSSINTKAAQDRWQDTVLQQMDVVTGKMDQDVWQLSLETKAKLNMAAPGVKVSAYQTDLGAAIWGDNQEVLSQLDEPIHLCVTSPPYPLRVARKYGNVAEKEWVDFMVESLRPIVQNLVPGGSIILNVSNDIFESKKPSRSLYLERMVLALHDELDLSLMDRIPWVNYSKPPGPTWWTCRQRKQLSHAWEPIYWFTNDPLSIRSNNNRVLQPHTENHKKLMAKGGDQRSKQFGDGAYTLRPGSFGRETEGKIARNVIEQGSVCKDSTLMRKLAAELGLPTHAAMFPTAIADFFIEFLTQPGELVVDPFSGSNKVGLSAERSNRRWLAVEKSLQYIRTQADAFTEFEGYSLNPAFNAVGNKKN